MDVTDFDDPESADAGPLDLTPRTPRSEQGSKSSKRGAAKSVPIVLGVLVLGAIAAVLVTQLAGAATYFYNVDDAVAQRSEIGDRRVRLQGNVIKGSEIGRTKDSVQGYLIAYNGVSVEVEQSGDVPDLFGPSIPVVIEGRFVGDVFKSDRVLVKHDETYDEANKDRVKEAERDAERNASSTTVPQP